MTHVCSPHDQRGVWPLSPVTRAMHAAGRVPSRWQSASLLHSSSGVLHASVTCSPQPLKYAESPQVLPGQSASTAQAAFAIMLPLAVIWYSKLKLALAVRRKGMAGPELVLALARRRIWHQFFAVLAMLGAAGLAMTLHPRIPLP